MSASTDRDAARQRVLEKRRLRNIARGADGSPGPSVSFSPERSGDGSGGAHSSSVATASKEDLSNELATNLHLTSKETAAGRELIKRRGSVRTKSMRSNRGPPPGLAIIAKSAEKHAPMSSLPRGFHDDELEAESNPAPADSSRLNTSTEDAVGRLTSQILKGTLNADVLDDLPASPVPQRRTSSSNKEIDPESPGGSARQHSSQPVEDWNQLQDSPKTESTGSGQQVNRLFGRKSTISHRPQSNLSASADKSASAFPSREAVVSAVSPAPRKPTEGNDSADRATASAVAAVREMYERKLQAKNAELVNLKGLHEEELEKRDHDLAEKNAEIRRLMSAQQQLKSENEGLQKTIAAHVEATAASSDSKTAELEKLTSELAALKNELLEKSKAADDLREEMKAKAESRVSASEELSRLRKDNHSLKVRVDELTAAAEDRESQYQKRERKLKAMHYEEVMTLRKKLERIEELRAQYKETAAKNKETLGEIVRSLRSENAELMEDNAQLKVDMNKVCAYMAIRKQLEQKYVRQNQHQHQDVEGS